MYEHFIEFINQNNLLKNGDRVLLAISGGMDSMAMAELFRLSAFQYAIAHCNFQLRGKAADKDEAFVRSYASDLQLDYFSRKFDTAAYASQKKISVQMAARELRYLWLEEVREQNGYQSVATAHHFNDSIETLFINILRGTGVDGLKGIPKKNQHIIRPLLFATRENIQAFIQKHKLKFREDASNLEVKYMRNRIRHRLVPLLHEINPSVTGNLRHFFNRMEAAAAFYQDTVNNRKKFFLRFSDHTTEIHIKQLLEQEFPDTLLYESLKDYGFSPSQSRDIYNCLHSQPGKTFQSASHTLVKDREMLMIIPRESATLSSGYSIDSTMSSMDCGKHSFRFETGKVDDEFELPKKATTLMADKDKLAFPLLLRQWQPGDKLVPLGMKGHKKVSDILIDKKIPLPRKKDIMVLLSGDEIVWVAGIVAAESFRITNDTTDYFMAKIH
jgi:tRNA(Ile)-lysidine synthase